MNPKKADENLLDLAKEKAQEDKQLLALEWALAGIGLAAFLATIILAIPIIAIDFALATAMYIIGLIFFAAVMFSALKIEQIAGYYKCAKCGHKHVPTFGAVFLAIHFGRTRHLRCPKCGEKKK